MRAFTAAAALVATLTAQTALAAEPPCLTPGEFTALSTYALPSMITGTTQRCAASLPADAWLKRNGPALAQRYARIRPAAWTRAKPAVLKLAGSTGGQTAEVFRAMPDANLQQMADAFIEGLVTQRVPADRCSVIDRMVRLVSPLPPENTAELIGLTVGLTSRSTGGGRFGALRICAPAAQP